MSNSYFNRARTAKNRVNDSSDVIECINSSNHIYYVRTNQHEYLVDLSFSATTVSGGGFTRDLYEMKCPDVNFETYRSKAVSHLNSNYPIGNNNIDLIPPVGEYNNDPNSTETVRHLILNPYFLNNIFQPDRVRKQYSYSSDSELQNTLSRLGWNEYRDFDYNNLINSRYVDHYHIYRNSTSDPRGPQWKTPFTYCSDLTTMGLSWGLPTIEVLSALLWFQDKKILSNRVVDHYYSSTNNILDDKHVVFGIFTQHLVKVISETKEYPSLVQMVVSLNKLSSNPVYDNISRLNTDYQDTYTTDQGFDIDALIPDGGSSTRIPTALIVCNSIRTRLGIRSNSITGQTENTYYRDLPMLIIPTAIIR